MDSCLLIISCLILIFFLKDIVAIIIVLCLLTLAVYYLTEYTDNTYIQNIFITPKSQ